MSLKNQKGIVRYQGRDDIVCSYGIRDDGMQFYYLDSEGAVFKNGNRIATTALVEAVDPMVKASNMGVIDSEGKEVIPCTNRSVRPVNGDIILVEPATPTSQSVNEAIKLKSDPLSATKLVSTPALIKDKLNSKVGAGGRYLFNDQFSEATVCDINGNNLVNGESYSFIVSDGKNLYFSKNTADSEITNYSILPPEVQSNVTPTGASQAIDVSAVDVSKEAVEQALTNQAEDAKTDPVTTEVANNIEKTEVEAENVAIAKADENSVQENSETPETTVENDEVSEETTDSVQDTNIETGFEIPTVSVDIPSLPESVIPTVAESSVEEKAKEEVENSIEEVTTEKEVEDSVKETTAPEEVVEESMEENDDKEEIVENPVEEVATQEEVVEEEVTAPEEIAEDSITDTQLNEDIVSPHDTVIEEEKDDALSDLLDTTTDSTDLEDIEVNNDISDIHNTNLDDVSFDEDIDGDDIFNQSKVQVDHIDSIDNFDADFMDNVEEEHATASKDNIMADVAKSMMAMMNRIRILEAELSEEKARSDKLNSSRRTLIEKNQMLGKKADAYKNKASSLGAVVAQTNSKNSLLENRVHEQKRVIEAQSQELQVLRPLLQGKEEVVGILADVQALLDQNAA